MKKLIFFIVMLFTLSTVTMVFAQSQDSDDNLCILQVDGSGTAKAAPDRATVSVGISTFNQNAGKAQGENADIAEAIRQAVTALGVQANEIKTSNYSFNPSYKQNNGNKIAGYNVNNTMIITVNDISKTGKIIDAALHSGANKVNSLDFSIKNPEPVRREAMEDAIQDARTKAEILAEGLGVRIVGIKLITENVGRISTRNAPMMLMAKTNMVMDEGYAETPISTPEDLDVSANIHVEYIIQ